MIPVVTITGDRRAELRFEQFPEQARHFLRIHIERLTTELESRVKAAEPEKSGQLRRDTEKRVQEFENAVVGRVSITDRFAKAAALEYGAHGTTPVKSHAARLNHVFGMAVAPMTVVVAAHARHLNIAEHRFLRGPLAAISSEVIVELEQALVEATQVDGGAP